MPRAGEHGKGRVAPELRIAFSAKAHQECAAFGRTQNLCVPAIRTEARVHSSAMDRTMASKSAERASNLSGVVAQAIVHSLRSLVEKT